MNMADNDLYKKYFYVSWELVKIIELIATYKR
jgi:hypothetical protein